MKDTRVRILVIAACLLAQGFLSHALAQSEDQEAGGFFSRGIALFAKGHVDSAINEFSMSIRLDRKNPLVYFQRARAYEYKKQYARALDDYTQAIACKPDYAAARYYRGYLYQKDWQLDKAYEDYTAIIESGSSTKGYRANAYNNRGLILQRKMEYLKAIDDFSRAASLIPSLVNVYYNRGCAYLDDKQYDLALNDFHKELEWFPRSFGPLHHGHMVEAYLRRDYTRSWAEAVTLMKGGERVSLRFLMELMRKRHKKISTQPLGSGKGAVPGKSVLRSW